MSTRQRRILLIILGCAVSVGLVVSGFLLLLPQFLPFANERDCSQGEAPADRVEGGGRACFEEGNELPAGWHWDPDGNQPLGR